MATGRPPRPLNTGSSLPRITHPIVFFDGVCGLCNRFVDALVRADRAGVLRFAPIQGETARALLPPSAADPAAWSVIYLDEHGLHTESDAALVIGRRLGGGWRLVGALRLVPRPIRDALYRTIAGNRYRWFGRRAVCRVPGEDERSRFLP